MRRKLGGVRRRIRQIVEVLFAAGFNFAGLAGCAGMHRIRFGAIIAFLRAVRRRAGLANALNI